MSLKVKGDIVLNYHDSLICEEDIQLLEGPFWLNDTLIGFYMEYLEKEEFNNVSVCFVRPELTQCLKLSADINVFLDPIEFKYKAYAVMTVNDCVNPNSPGGSHWSLLVFHRDHLKFYHIDSSEGTNLLSAKQLAQKITAYFSKDLKCNFQTVRSLQQSNSYDCGVFVLCNLDNVLHHIFKRRDLSRVEPISFEQVSRKREDLKRLILNLYRREASKPEPIEEDSEEDIEEDSQGGESRRRRRRGGP